MTKGPGFQTTPGSTVLVTGSSGLVGQRLVEMLLERGAKKVVCFDVVAPDSALLERFKVAAGGDSERFRICSGMEDGNLTNKSAISKACKGVDILYHIAALVGPFHDRDKYFDVNYHGTMNLLQACKEHKVGKMVNSSSPSTRFHGPSIRGLREDELTFPKKYLALYAETKAMAEKAVTASCSDDFLTINVAPHQVYGPHDSLFLPNLLETAGHNLLRVFGSGNNKISVCYNDNYCHGLMCGADALVPKSPVLGKFYIITDDHDVYFWKFINEAIVAMGFKDIFTKFHLSVLLLMTLAYICNVVGFIINKKLKLSPFNVKMLTIDRYFSIENAKKDLKYVPVVAHNIAWKSTIEWFKVNWLPGFLEKQQKKSSKKVD